MTHEFDAEAYILEHFDEIQEEALEKMRSRRSFKFLGDYREMATLH